MAERSDEWVTVAGDDLHYVAAGDPTDPPVVLIHGGIIDAAHISWGPLVDALAADYRVLALDLLGYGRSDKPDVTYSLDRHVRTVAAALDAMGRERVAIAGISMGGGVGLGVALDTSVRIERLALLDSYGLGTTLASGLSTYLLSRVGVLNKLGIALSRRSRRLTRASLGGIVDDVDAVNERLVDLVFAETKREGVGRAFRSFRRAEVTREGYRTDFTPRLDTLDVPTLLIHGAKDEVFPPTWSRRAARRLPDASCHVLDSCAHLPTWERTERVEDLLETFLSN